METTKLSKVLYGLGRLLEYRPEDDSNTSSVPVRRGVALGRRDSTEASLSDKDSANKVSVMSIEFSDADVEVAPAAENVHVGRSWCTGDGLFSSVKRLRSIIE